MASLDSVRLKVNWAYRHFKAYDDELLRYFSSEPCEVVPDADSDPQGRVRILFKQTTPIPVEIPLIIGDGIQNLRSALDYLVCELVRTTSQEPTVKHMFPICDSVDAFEAQCKRGRLDGVPLDAVAEIKALQPYHYGPNMSTAPIRVLDDLCNINKHQRICLTVLAATQSQTQFVSTRVGRSVHRTLSPRYSEAELAVSHIPTMGEEMEVEGGAFFQIAFEEGPIKGREVSGVVDALWKLLDRTIIPAFERFFP